MCFSYCNDAWTKNMEKGFKQLIIQSNHFFAIKKKLRQFSFPVLFACMPVIMVASCKESTKEKIPNPEVINEQLTQLNRRHVAEESKLIEEFINRHSFKTKRTGTGLRYEIYRQGSGEHPIMQSEVEINYKIFLLDSSFCYSSDSTGKVKMVLGASEQLRGLVEALLLMVPGDKARLVLPAHLGYGTSGDGNKIPPSSALLLDVELIKVKK